jgi:hypothetical protein
MLIAYSIEDPFGGILLGIFIFALFYQVWMMCIGEVLVWLGVCDFNPFD